MVAPPDVAVVFPSAHQRGGVERVAWDLLHFLVRDGRTVAFVGHDLAAGADPRIRVVRVPGSPLLPAPVAFRRAATRVLSELDPCNTVSLGANCPPGDVLLVGSVHRSWLRAARTVPLLGRDVTAKIRYAMPRHLVLLGLERAYFRDDRPRAVVCCSRREADDLAELYAVSRDRLLVVPNGYDAEVFAPQPAARRAETRARMGVQDDAVVLLLMANELHRKGFGTMLAAVALLDDPRVQVAVVGRADIDGYLPEVRRLGLSGRVRWFGPTSDAASWYAGADVLVLPSQYEPFGLVIIEALATGLPVITTALAGAADAIVPGVNGLLQDEPFDVAELAQLLAVAGDDATRARWAAAAPATVTRFRQDVVFAELAELLR